MERLNPDGTRYYTSRQTLWRAALAGFTFGAFPRDYPDADRASSWTRIGDLITHIKLERLE